MSIRENLKDHNEDVKADSWIMRWSKFFIEKYRITILLVILVIIGGVTGYMRLPQEMNPPGIDIGLAVVTVTYPGASAGEMEDDVTGPIEEAVENLEHVKDATSSSGNSFSSILIRFEEGSDTDKMIEDLNTELDKLTLPEDANDPEVMNVGADDFAAWQIAVAGDYSKVELTNYAKQIKDKLRGISGISSIEIVGGAEEEIRVELDREEMKKKGLTISDVGQAIEANNLSFPGGKLATEDYEFNVVNESELASIDDLKNMVVGFSGFDEVKLDDIADVEIKEVEQEKLLRTGYQEDGELAINDSVSVNINKAENVNVRAVDEEVTAAINEVKENELPENLKVEVIWRDADQIDNVLGQMTSSAWQGLIIVAIVLMIFISIRSGLLIAILIPLIFLCVFLLFSLFGFSLNMITLFSLVLVLGMLVDNSIVIVEAIQHNLDRGLERKKAVLNAVKGVGPAVIAATITTLIVFLPIAMVTGVVGQYVRLMPYTVLFALGSSLLLAFTLTPFLGYLFMKPHKKRKGQKKGEVNYGRAVLGYYAFIQKTLKKVWARIAVIVIAVVLFVASVWLPLSGILEAVQFPEGDAELIYVTVNLPKDSQKDSLNATMGQIEQAILEQGEVKNFAVERTGLAGTAMVFLTPITERKITSIEILDNLNKQIDEIESDGRIYATVYGMGPPVEEYNTHFQVMGDDIAGLEKVAPEIALFLEKQEGVLYVDDGVSDRGREIQIEYDREKIADEGLSNIMIAAQVKDLLQGIEAGSLGDNKIKVTFREEDKDQLTDLQDLEITTPLGKTVKLEDITDVIESRAENTISHKDGQRYVEVSARADLDSEKLGLLNESVKNEFTPEKLEEMGLANGYIDSGGLFDDMMEAYGNLFQALILAVILVFLVLVAQFKSFLQPFIILLALPMAMIGVFPGLLIFGEVVSFMAFVGIIALLGVVVNDSIVLIDQINRLRAEGKNLIEATAKGAMARFKPIIATTVTTIGGLIPITITDPFWRGIGITIMCGLAVATLLTLIVIPVIYVILEAMKIRIKKRAYARSSRS
ncbi:efflux RND transporter permease subunit [Patescibacteria group bacterium]|nr:efflux RND transporter permease subunit [Patescibacteria group bacterium]MBU1673074.1 efflux RND transporter permease subunit [Patescibacteria group bacterium]MBU1963680.1 efflux RND transporter permease subunit [Patescibacteria group bacterium]